MSSIENISGSTPLASTHRHGASANPADTPEAVLAPDSNRVKAKTAPLSESDMVAKVREAQATIDPQRLGDVPLEGYNHEKLHNPAHKTPKYLFGRVATRYPLDQVKNHDDAERLLKQMIPELKASGLEFGDPPVKGDRIQVKTELGYEWVDVVRGAGSGNPGWWWGSEGFGTPAPTPSARDAARIAGRSPAPAASPPSGPAQDWSWADDSRIIDIILRVTALVKKKYPHLFVEGDDRARAYEIMTHVMEELKAEGVDSHRVVNHPSRPVGDPHRYGSDALVINGFIYDVYRGLGDAGDSTPQALNQGPYDPGRPRE